VTRGVDYSWGRPNPGHIKAAGYSLVIRYLGGSPSKDLTAQEAAGLRAAGLDIALVWETAANRATTGGAVGGESDARTAAAQAHACGAPPGAAIYFAVDEDTRNFGAIELYLTGAHRGIGAYSVGVYGSHDVVEAMTRAGLAAHRWQTEAWSRGRLYPGAHLFQHANPVYVDGVQCDVDDVLNPDYGGWAHHGTPLPQPRPQVHNPHPAPSRVLAFPPSRTGHPPGHVVVARGVEMQAGSDVMFVQWGCGMSKSASDGLFGHDTDGAVRVFQGHHHDRNASPLAVDGIVGPSTLWALEQVHR